METFSQIRWRVPSHAKLRWYQWGDEFVVHHALSNDTHRLSKIPGQIVARLSLNGEQTESALASHFEVQIADMQALLAELTVLDYVTCHQ